MQQIYYTTCNSSTVNPEYSTYIKMSGSESWGQKEAACT